ncbi:predicted protein [Plenodomus lingam JN3]|uniref:Predicted protein n=1 Tax=Leptosphaeria maculans (strain JN3 / isolate v23.1.3 / race Av1-4-5-6-7-8) TaxID=985895 RepID=E4ZRY8_LEPMJ|nr:predicted protein [Plenodomus lingam JN3]CBX94168.1 predicted protein [Plenodomus lingam JN3]
MPSYNSDPVIDEAKAPERDIFQCNLELPNSLALGTAKPSINPVRNAIESISIGNAIAGVDKVKAAIVKASIKPPSIKSLTIIIDTGPDDVSLGLGAVDSAETVSLVASLVSPGEAEEQTDELFLGRGIAESFRLLSWPHCVSEMAAETTVNPIAASSKLSTIFHQGWANTISVISVEYGGDAAKEDFQPGYRGFRQPLRTRQKLFLCSVITKSKKKVDLGVVRRCQHNSCIVDTE